MTVRGAGLGIGGTSDQFQYVYLGVTGDVDIRVRLSDLDAVNPGAAAGLMIRESLNATSRSAAILLSAEQIFAFQWRAKTSGKAAQTTGALQAAPAFLRLVRQGNVFRGYSSPTGAAWTLVGSATITMNTNAYVGLAVTGDDPNQAATATFSNLAVDATPTPTVPPPWTARDISGPVVTGSATASSGIFTVTGSGNICCTSDQFQFVYQPITGDTQIIALVSSLQAADPWSKGGVMIRSALTGSSAHASVMTAGADGSNGFFTRSRPSTGASSDDGAISGGGTPRWLRLVREGTVFSGYLSADGSHWTLVGTDTISMPATVYVGLVVTSRKATALSTAKFSNVAISQPASSNTPPTVSMSSPQAGATYAAPASIPLGATAGDVDGSVSGVAFYAGTQLVGSATASPFSATWSSVPAGTYTLKAVATDNAGATSTSAAITVSVTAAPQPPTILPATLVFVPGADYATNADSVTVQLHRGADAITAAPVASRNLGKPAVAGGEVSVDISPLVDPLAAGTYYAVVVTTGPGGSTPSSPSPVFSK